MNPKHPDTEEPMGLVVHLQRATGDRPRKKVLVPEGSSRNRAPLPGLGANWKRGVHFPEPGFTTNNPMVWAPATLHSLNSLLTNGKYINTLTIASKKKTY